MKNNHVAVKRHSLLYRILHWAIVALILVLLLSGLGVSEYISVPILAKGIARSLHIVLGLAWTGVIAFFFYYFVLCGEYKWFGLARLGHSFDFFVHEVKCFIEGKKVKNPIKYEAERQKYLEKIIPTEVLAFWGWMCLWGLMVLTGLALVFPAQFNLVNRLSQTLLPVFENPAAATRLIHLSISVLIFMYAMVHAYASWVFGVLGSIFSGTSQVTVTTEEQ